MTSDPQIHYRRATMDDARLLFEWANDPDVRAASFSSEPIPWEDHLSWLARRIDDDAHRLLVFSVNNKNIGLVRLMFVGERIILSYLIDKNYRGQGYGSRVIKSAVEFLITEGLSKAIHAYVKVGNEKSMNAILKAGFTSLELETVDGIAAYHLILPNDHA